MIYHISTKEAWKKAIAENSYSGDTLLTEGFIHCSKVNQVAGSLNKHFKGKSDLLLLFINEELLVSKLVYEPSMSKSSKKMTKNTCEQHLTIPEKLNIDENLSGGDNLFPHIYGTLNTNAVEKIMELKPNNNGDYDIKNL